jgi:hypothetical protein
VKFKKDDEGKLVLDDAGDPIAISESGEVIPLDKVVSVGKYSRVEAERDELKTKVGELEGQIAELGKGAGDAEALKAKVDELTARVEADKTEFDARMAVRDKEYALDTALLAAGCRDTKAARAHVDMEALKVEGGKLAGFDPESFKKDRPYLFGETETVSTGLPSNGASESAETAARLNGMREAAGLPAKE